MTGAAAADEKVLLERLRAGEDAAYEELVRAYAGRLLAVARRYLPVEDDAQDAVQDAFLSAFRGVDRFEGNAKLSTWLHRIVVNACLMKLRTRRRKPETPIDDLLPGFLEDGHLEEPVSEWRELSDEARLDLIDEIGEATRAMALELGVIGLMNVQYAVKSDTLYVLEVNPRASRTVPFVSKATGIPFAKLAANAGTCFMAWLSSAKP